MRKIGVGAENDKKLIKIAIFYTSYKYGYVNQIIIKIQAHIAVCLLLAMLTVQHP